MRHPCRSPMPCVALCASLPPYSGLGEHSSVTPHKLNPCRKGSGWRDREGAFPWGPQVKTGTPDLRGTPSVPDATRSLAHPSLPPSTAQIRSRESARPSSIVIPALIHPVSLHPHLASPRETAQCSSFPPDKINGGQTAFSSADLSLTPSLGCSAC